MVTKVYFGRWCSWGLAGLVLSVSASVTAAESPAPATQPSVVAPPAMEVSSGGPGNDLTNMSLEDLMNVEVTTVSRQKQRISEAPAAVSVITADDIARSGLTTIPDLLRLAPGMDVARVNGNTWAIGARGFNDTFSNKLLVAMDGRSIYSPLFGGVFWDQQDYILQDLERIEVIRGPGATLWGANAVDGVVNIQSKNARDTQGWLLSGMGGNQEQSGSIRYGGTIDDNTAFRVYSKYRRFDAFDADSDETSAPRDMWESEHTGFRLDRNTSPNDTFTFSGEVFGEEFNETVKDVRFTPPFAITEYQHGNADGGNLLGRATHTFSTTSSMSLQVYYDRMDRYEGLFDYQQDTVDIDFQHRFALTQRNELIWGLGYRAVWDRFDGTGSFVMDRRDLLMQYTNGFIQDDLTIVPDRLHFIAGTKLEYNTFSGLEVSPSARVLFTPDDKNTFWGAISRAVRTPTLEEQDVRNYETAVPLPTGAIGAAGLEPNHYLQSEELLAYELGCRARPAKNVSVDIAGFYNHYDHLAGTQTLAPQPTGSATPPQVFIPIQFQNNLRGETYGGEVSATWNVTDNWRLSGGYSLTEIDLHPTSAGADPREAYFEGTTPQQQLQLHSYMNLTRNVELNTSAYYVSPLAVEQVPGYVRLDAGVVWRPSPNLELSFTVQNILDNHHTEFTDIGGYTLTSQTPRSLYGQVTYRF